MADFVCLPMAPQVNTDEEHVALSPVTSTSSSPRRSIHLTSSLLGRTFSRSSGHNRHHHGATDQDTTTTNNNNSNNSCCTPVANSIHIRIIPSIENPGRSLIFDIVDRDLEVGTVIKIGRFTDRMVTHNHISFKSKVVSRLHCELWLDNDGKLYIRDTKSSSGTFLNHVRLSAPNKESRATEIRDGDIVQLGVDYQGGIEEVYRAVRMRFEVNRKKQEHPASYHLSSFQHIRNLTSAIERQDDDIQVEECCICLYAIAPFQALFVSPCSHTYHFKCIRPLLQSYPGFQCPLCRTYSDLEASVAIEAEEVIEKYGPKATSTLETPLEDGAHPVETEPEPIPATNTSSPTEPLSTTLVPSPSNLADMTPCVVPPEAPDRRATLAFDGILDESRLAHSPPRRSAVTERRVNPSNLVDKLKMAFSDKRKRTSCPVSYPSQSRSSDEEDESGDDPHDVASGSSSSFVSPSSSPPQRACYMPISRQSTGHQLDNIVEEMLDNVNSSVAT